MLINKNGNMECDTTDITVDTDTRTVIFYTCNLLDYHTCNACIACNSKSIGNLVPYEANNKLFKFVLRICDTCEFRPLRNKRNIIVCLQYFV